MMLSWSHFPIETYGVITGSVYLEAQSWQRACWLFATMEQSNIPRSVISFSAAISSCAKGSQWQHALSLFKAFTVDQRLVQS